MVTVDLLKGGREGLLAIWTMNWLATYLPSEAQRVTRAMDRNTRVRRPGIEPLLHAVMQLGEERSALACCTSTIVQQGSTEAASKARET
jgi:hypothetical protein